MPHLTVHGTGDDTVDVYAFDVVAAGDRGIFDVDFGETDTHLRLFDAAGTLLASNDDAISRAYGGLVNRDHYFELDFRARPSPPATVPSG